MMFEKPFFLLLVIVTSSFDSLAAEVYRTVDENGAVVFSDKKTHDAEKVKVQPNVIGIERPVMPESTTQRESKKKVSSKPKSVEQEMVGQGTANGGNLRRRVRTETNGEGINRAKPSVTPAGGSGGGRTRGGR